MWTILALLCALGNPVATPGVPAKRCLDTTEIVRYFTFLHGKDWQSAKPATVSNASPAHLNRLDVTSSDAGATMGNPCAGSIVMTNRAASPECYLWIVFEEAGRPPCSVSLKSATWRATLPLSDAMIVASEIREALKAGGKPTGTQWDSTYEWRSHDSKQAFELVSELKGVAANPTPDSSVDLMVRLRHFTADPSDIDLLPFERGTFFKDCKPAGK